MPVQKQSEKDTCAKFKGNPTNGLVTDGRSQTDGRGSPHKVFFFHNAIKPHKDKKLFFLTHGSVHRNSVLIKIQPDATVCRYLFTAVTLHVPGVTAQPDQATLEGSSCTDIMTCTGGCSYSF